MRCMMLLLMLLWCVIGVVVVGCVMMSGRLSWIRLNGW